ncbi:TadE/TadG family type IV pilus assembly protein [Bosea sp. BH3]|uniref:TadE/TadG family type IV pilus assembly protein n=1 Tax=Bosea sp. BH3 TaxID=2871701 RepID=UPI0021CB6234|nr:TadE/TadG family type IV pilus assembly protein [Bosea sp. BH3]MCU4181486.1 pilus assembly protein [Bosea sp. BH3]
MSVARQNSPLLRLLRRFRRARDGVAIVEFAMVLPFLMIAYCGLVDVAQLVMVNRKVTLLTSTLSDLTARMQSAPVAEISNIFEAARTVLLPYDATRASMVIASVVIDSAGVGRICWSSSYPAGTPAPARGTTVVLPDSVRIPSTSVIMARASYRFTPIIGEVVTGPVTLGDNPIYARPRNGKADGSASIEQIVRSDVNACPAF